MNSDVFKGIPSILWTMEAQTISSSFTVSCRVSSNEWGTSLLTAILLFDFSIWMIVWLPTKSSRLIKTLLENHGTFDMIIFMHIMNENSKFNFNFMYHYHSLLCRNTCRPRKTNRTEYMQTSDVLPIKSNGHENGWSWKSFTIGQGTKIGCMRLILVKT